MSNEKNEKDVMKEALQEFQIAINRMSTRQELLAYCRMMAGCSIKMMATLEGQEFKQGFLLGAMEDQEVFKIKAKH